MIELLKAYKNYDPAAKSILEILFLYPGPRALFFHRIITIMTGAMVCILLCKTLLSQEQVFNLNKLKHLLIKIL